MRIFVASWFFPPATSSEGIVSYKLLRNSRHTHDVCSAKSDLWGYKKAIPLNADNIKLFPVETDSLDDWVSEAVEIFAREHEANPYDALMTRCMPPESIEVAKRIKERFPDVFWISSLADPIARSPYHIRSMIEDNEGLREDEKRNFIAALDAGAISGWMNHRSNEVRYLCGLKSLEDYALDKADALIFPCDTLKSFMLAGRVRKNVLVVPHSYDRSLYPAESAQAPKDAPAGKPVAVSFLGHTDDLRSLEPVVRALQFLRQNDPEALDGIRFRFVGHVTESVRALIYNYYLYDMIDIESDVDYLTSLQIMAESDWLLHVDAWFDRHEETGGSLFFAGKLADYMGTRAPILSLTGKHSPADIMTERAGGISVSPTDIPALSRVITRIAAGDRPEVNHDYRSRFDAVNIAARYDEKIESLLRSEKAVIRTDWQPAPERRFDRKMMSICIPAYNVEQYLDRCLHSLIACRNADALQIIIVNDGSKDATVDIARAFEQRYPSIIEVIDKENGGHGSTINAALKVATGEYFRVIDGDDWVDSANLDKTIDRMIANDVHADVVSSNYHQVYMEDGALVPWMKEGDFEDYVDYDFASTDFSGEYFTMAASMFRTEVLRAADFQIQEHTFYVDVEYLLFPIPYCKTVAFTPEYVYRYAVGNAGQSINPETFTRRYDHHDRVIRRMLRYYAEHKPAMGVGQKEYMESLFVRHLIPSHFTLSLVWDTDRKRGCARAKDFDEFLRGVDADLHAACGKRIKALRVARRHGFDPDRFKAPADIGKVDPKRMQNAKTRMVERLYRSDIGHALAKNKLLYKVYARFFREAD